MRIGVDATCWQNTRGYGRHARALLTALVRLDSDNEYTFFLDSEEGAASLPARARRRLLPAAVPTSMAASASGHRSLAGMWRISRAISSEALDILLFPTIYSYVPVVTRARKLVMIHDVIAETYPRLTLPRTTARLLWNAKVALGRLQADAIITVSEYSRRLILERFHIEPGRVSVVGEASDPVFRVLDGAYPTPALVARGVRPGRRIVTYVGGFGPHKNLEPLVSAFARLGRKPGFEDALLVMVGEYESEVFHSTFGALSRQVDDLGIRDRVVFTGYLTDEELVILLNISTVLALPSLMEGFGLPAVEAAACGCPVIATKASPLPELLGGGGIFIDPHGAGLEEALETVLASGALREQMRREGIAAASRLTWDAAARQMQRVFREVAAN